MSNVALACIYSMHRSIAQDGDSVLIKITFDLHVVKKFVGTCELGSGKVCQFISITIWLNSKFNTPIAVFLGVRFTFLKSRTAENQEFNLSIRPNGLTVTSLLPLIACEEIYLRLLVGITCRWQWYYAKMPKSHNLLQFILCGPIFFF